MNRAVFYVSRLVSSQKEWDFVKTNYNDIKRVFSIWICMNMDENSMAYVHLAKDDLLGFYPWKGGLDDRIREDVSAMCNLSQGIRENATDNAIAGIIMNMYENSFTLEQIAVAP